MVQRKPPKKLGPRTESPERRRSLPHHQQDAMSKGGGGGGLVSRKTKKPSPPTKASDGPPNYMKPTSSSGARKEPLQVPVHSPIATDKNRSPRKSTNSKASTSSSPVDSGIKPARSLTRNSSLKPMRSSMKKSSGMGFHPKKNATRATCSSTLKDSKLPKASGLEQGEIEPEGTPVLKVCHYTYCSLHDHKHDPLPPLKCFLSARRRLVKAQNSMKLKRLSSLIAVSSTPEGLQINPLFEEVDIDFLFEIPAKPRDMVNSEVLEGLSRMCLHESSLGEFVECDQQVKATEDGKGSDCFTNVCGKDGEDPAEGEANLSATFESIDAQSEEEAGSYPDSKTDYTEELDGGFDPILGPESSTLDDGFDEEGDGSTDTDVASLAASVNSQEEEKSIKTPTITYAVPLLDAGGKPKARNSRRRWKKTDDAEGIREFNPRAPRFLPLEPDPEAEKVGLRHQGTDERKNAEEWMLDYALRQAVAKLAPAREKKVELLVEAFETIKPLHTCETPLRPVPGLARASPVQACS